MDPDSSVFSLGNNEMCWFLSSLLSLGEKKVMRPHSKVHFKEWLLFKGTVQLTCLFLIFDIIITIIYYIQS